MHCSIKFRFVKVVLNNRAVRIRDDGCVFVQDVFTNAAPVSGGIGMFLLQKMGWKHGEGLGKNNEGAKEPLMLDFKIDRKGNNLHILKRTKMYM